MLGAPWSARLASVGCATAAATLATVVLAAPAHAAEPIAGCPTGFNLTPKPADFPPEVWAEIDLNSDDFVCVKQVRPMGFVFIDNRVRF